jgi:hypothetical protein
LQHVAFQGAKLDDELESAFKQFVNDDTRNKFDSGQGTLYLSKIFDWFKADFESGGGVAKVIEKYGPAAAKDVLRKEGKIKYLPYDWSLNESGRPLSGMAN